jgi:hypothetical protein
VRLATPDLAQEVAAVVAQAFADAGGIDLARRAEVEPAMRQVEIAPLLTRLGVLDLKVGDSLDTLMAAAEVCRAAGAVALPYPVVPLLVSPDRALVPLQHGADRADHADLLVGGVAFIIGGSGRGIVSVRTAGPGRLAPFAGDVVLGETCTTVSDRQLAVWFTLSAWWVLGATERALALTVKHVNQREQFGASLARLQSVRFHVADITVLIRGLVELTRYTCWRLFEHPDDALVDSLALRVVAQETATATFKTAHQLHGATGFCDEHDLSILSRHVQPYLRLPLDYEATTVFLMQRMDSHGFDGLFGRHC